MHNILKKILTPLDRNRQGENAFDCSLYRQHYFTYDDFELINYQSHTATKAPVAV